MSGDRDRCSVVRGEILEVLASRKEWYSFLYSNFFGWGIPLSIGGFFGFSLADVTIDWKNSSPFILKFWFLIVLAPFAAYWLRRLLFPKLQFDFGKSGRRASAVEKWRTFIFIFVIAGLILGVVASLIASRMASSS
jgi:ribose/xylose/arabinose/galactoside ABC-type transport system permease subunit